MTSSTAAPRLLTGSGWPSRHPVFRDPALRPFADAAQAAVPNARVVKVFRHVPGHRVTSLVEAAGHRQVVKVRAEPLGRSTDQHLRSLARAGAAGVVPYPRSVDEQGHVSAFSYHPGTMLGGLDDRHLLGACVRLGAALRRLHDCGAAIDRRWSADDEVFRVRRWADPPSAPALAVLGDRRPRADPGELVVSHRHCRPGHVVVDSGGSVRLLDFDMVSIAPRGLDVGNLLAHLRRDGVRGVRRTAVGAAAANAFLLGYGSATGLDRATLDWWTSLALLRLAGLAVVRRNDVVERDLLIRAATQAQDLRAGPEARL